MPRPFRPGHQRAPGRCVALRPVCGSWPTGDEATARPTSRGRMQRRCYACPMGTRLSKSRFQKGLQCERALWLAVHEPDSADPVTESMQWMFDQGTEVGRLAHGLFPGGVEVTEDHLHSE